jgi:hypothetical protein
MLTAWRTRTTVGKGTLRNRPLTVIDNCAAAVDEVWSVQIRHREPKLSCACWNTI